MKLDVEHTTPDGHDRTERDLPASSDSRIGKFFEDERVVQVEVLFKSGSTSVWTRSEDRDA